MALKRVFVTSMECDRCGREYDIQESAPDSAEPEKQEAALRVRLCPRHFPGLNLNVVFDDLCERCEQVIHEALVRPTTKLDRPSKRRGVRKPKEGNGKSNQTTAPPPSDPPAQSPPPPSPPAKPKKPKGASK